MNTDLAITAPFPVLRANLEHYIPIKSNDHQSPLVDLVLDYAVDLKCLAECIQNDPQNSKFYQRAVSITLGVEFEVLSWIPEFLIKKIEDGNLSDNALVQKGCPIMDNREIKLDLKNIKLFKEDLEKLRENKQEKLGLFPSITAKHMHRIKMLEFMQVIGCLFLSPYVEDIEKNNWATNISKETLGIAKEYRKYLNMTSRESIKNLNERLQKKDPSLGIYSALALFSLIDFTGLGLGFMHPAKLEGKDFEMFMNQLAAACTTVPEKGLFLHKLITYWDDKMKSNSENSVGQEIMFITFRNILDLWKQDEDVILATVDRRGRSLLSLVVKYAIPGFSSKIANYDYSRQDLTGSRLSPQIAKIEDKRCCLIS